MKRILSLAIILIALAGCAQTSTKEINIYTARDYEIDKQIYKEFTEKTGIKLNVVENENEELLAKVKAEKDNQQADVIIVNGGQFISEFKKEGILKPIKEVSGIKDLKTELVGDDFIGLTYRTRAICYNPKKIDGSKISTYADLTKPEFANQIVVRSSAQSSNQAWIMNMIQNQGYEQTLNFAKGLVKNFARDPKGGDRDQIKAVYANEGNIAITNSYYYAQMLKSPDAKEVEAASACELKILDDTSINTTWLGVTSRGEKNKEVNQLIEFLTSKETQSKYAQENGEFPVNQTADFGYFNDQKDFKMQPINFETLGEEKINTQKVSKEAGWK